MGSVGKNLLFLGQPTTGSDSEGQWVRSAKTYFFRRQAKIPRGSEGQPMTIGDGSSVGPLVVE
jgi:hypothetical protein